MNYFMNDVLVYNLYVDTLAKPKVVNKNAEA